MRRQYITLAAAVILLMLSSCGEEEPSGPAGPEQTALRLFELAREQQPADDLIAALFEPGLGERNRAALLESLSAFSAPTAVQAVGSERLEGLERVVVDLSAELPAGGMASYSVQLEQAEQGEWKITWFQGPGLEWPRRERPRGEGLTTSAPPEKDGAP
jgi:hypothetical protein